jgi:hypothetical protein
MAATAMVMRRALKTNDHNTAGTRLRIYAIFLQNRNAQKLNNKIDMMISVRDWCAYLAMPTIF